MVIVISTTPPLGKDRFILIWEHGGQPWSEDCSRDEFGNLLVWSDDHDTFITEEERGVYLPTDVEFKYLTIEADE